MDVKLIAAKTTMWHKAGDPITKPAMFAKAMVALGLARYVDKPKPAPKKRGRLRKVCQGCGGKGGNCAGCRGTGLYEPEKRKRQYKRRDMTAESGE